MPEAEDRVSWWRGISAHVWITWIILGLGFTGSYVLRSDEVRRNTAGRQVHEAEYKIINQQVTDLQYRVTTIETLMVELRAGGREVSATLIRMDKQLTVLIPAIDRLALSYRELAEKLDKR